MTHTPITGVERLNASKNNTRQDLHRQEQKQEQVQNQRLGQGQRQGQGQDQKQGRNQCQGQEKSRGQGRDRKKGLATRLGKGLGAVFVVGSFLFWLWAFSPWARSENPARLDDRAFAAWAESHCARAKAEINFLPSPRNADSFNQRANQVEQGTNITERLVGDLRASAAGLSEETANQGPPDAVLVRAWLADWEVYLADRRAHAARLRNASDDTPDRDLWFVVSDVVSGGIYTERMDGFARVNNMDSCQIPGDV